MSLTIAQRAHVHDRLAGYWKWWVWIEGPDEELDRIEEVNYLLHPTFKKRNRQSRERAKKFRIASSGWGEFRIFAVLRGKDGGRQRLKHWLQLRADSQPATAGGEAPEKARKKFNIFMSHAASDTPMADALRASLESQGVTVTSANTVSVGDSFASSIENGIEAADGAVVLVSSRAAPSIEREVEIAQEKHIPVFPVIVAERNVQMPEKWASMERLVVKDSSDTGGLAHDIASRLTTQFANKL